MSDGWDSDDDGFGGAPSVPVTTFGRGSSRETSDAGSGRAPRGRGFGFGSGTGRGSSMRSDQDRSWRSKDERPGGSGRGMQGGGGGGSSGGLRIEVENRQLGRIIGRGGARIRELQDSSGARINILKDESDGNVTPVELSGSEDCQQLAKQLIEEIIDGQSGGGFRGGGGGGGGGQGGGFGGSVENAGPAECIQFPNSELSRLIGRGGARIRELQDSSGARINILKDKSDGNVTPVELSGSEDCQQLAKQLIEEIIDGQSGGGFRGGGGGGGGGGGQGGGFGGSVENAGPAEYIQFPSSELSRLIGRGGSRINEIQDESGCRVKILSDEAGTYDTPVRLQGTPEAIIKAKELINDITGRGAPQTNGYQSNTNTSSSSTVGSSGIDWAQLRANRENSEKARFAGLPDIVKNFYIEHPEVANRHPQEVAEIRSQNLDIQVVNLDEEGKAAIPNPIVTFEEAFEHYPEIMSEIERSGFQKPSPIQMQAWPIIMQGLDCIGIAQTGTGKTLAFLLPAFIHIEGQPVPRNKRPGPTVLVLSPTRELAQQIEQETKKYSYKGIQCVCVYGGGSRREQISLVRAGVEIIVATPGRLNDLIMADVISLKAVTYLILDEADRMLDMGFEPEIRKVLLDIRPDRQTIMTSATWPPDVRRLAESYMTNPMQVFVGSLDLRAVHSVTQLVEIMDEEDKKERLLYFLQHELGPTDKVIIFMGKKVKVDDIASDFTLAGIDCQSIHGDREQIDREQAIEDLKTGSVQILIATDVASRGLDIKDVTHVINYDFPKNMEEYVHRVGRTGRAGAEGTSLSFLTRRDWRNAQKLIEILTEAQQEVTDELWQMAQRYESRMQRDREGGGRFGGRGGGGGFSGGGGGFRGGRRRDDDYGGGDDYGISFGEFSGFGGGGFGGGGRRGGRGGRRRENNDFIKMSFGVP